MPCLHVCSIVSSQRNRQHTHTPDAHLESHIFVPMQNVGVCTHVTSLKAQTVSGLFGQYMNANKHSGCLIPAGQCHAYTGSLSKKGLGIPRCYTNQGVLNNLMQATCMTRKTDLPSKNGLVDTKHIYFLVWPYLQVCDSVSESCNSSHCFRKLASHDLYGNYCQY